MPPLLEWTTPTRQDHTGVLPPIPVEIYEEIFDYVTVNTEDDEAIHAGEDGATSNTLGHLALVCRLFCALALGRLFHTITFDYNRKKLRTTAFARALVLRDPLAVKLAPLVRVVVYANFRTPTSFDEAWYRMHLRAARRLPAVTTIVMRDALLSKDSMRTLDKTTGLKTLRLIDVPISDELKEEYTEADAEEATRGLLSAVSPPHELVILRTVIPPDLRLGLNVNKLRMLQTDSPMVLRAVLETRPPNLRVLDVDLCVAYEAHPSTPEPELLVALRSYVNSKVGRMLEERTVRLPSQFPVIVPRLV
ncbi:hypothetical protein BD626DRAFT_551085 [Schizophyllum amplum]|uniref:F-box domain-containing protein n=1 Tax=Schizophyllum amplum TaxID=97359 RepID=A0A550BY29_9AGAR|nr:hypothetical protein BD626DRAFT_551085 [Auriculariopsis ampla]